MAISILCKLTQNERRINPRGTNLFRSTRAWSFSALLKYRNSFSVADKFNAQVPCLYHSCSLKKKIIEQSQIQSMLSVLSRRKKGNKRPRSSKARGNKGQVLLRQDSHLVPSLRLDSNPPCLYPDQIQTGYLLLTLFPPPPCLNLVTGTFFWPSSEAGFKYPPLLFESKYIRTYRHIRTHIVVITLRGALHRASSCRALKKWASKLFRKQKFGIPHQNW